MGISTGERKSPATRTRAHPIQSAMPSTTCPSVGCSSIVCAPTSRWPGTGSAWTCPSDSGADRSRYSSSSKARRRRAASPGSAVSRAAVVSATPSAASGNASRPSRWSQSACVATRPLNGKPACSSSAGSTSSSSGSTGESTTRHSSPSRMIVQAVWKTREVATRTPACSPTTFTRLEAQELGRLEEVLHLGGRLLLAWLQRLLSPVDPDHGNLELHARLDVVVVAGRHVHPALLRPDSARTLVEVRRVGLVGANLLGGDDKIEVERDVPARLAEQLVVDVRDQAGVVAADELLQLRVGLLEVRPARHGVRQEARPARLERPVDALCDLDGGAAQHLGVELIGPTLDLARDLVEEADHLVAIDGEAVPLGLTLERVGNALLPVYERAIDIESDPVDLARERHWIGHCAIRAPHDAVRWGSDRVRRRSWTCSSTRASNCSRGTECRCRTASLPPASTRRSPPPTTSATHAWSRPRS